MNYMIDMKAFAAQYEQINERAERIYSRLEDAARDDVGMRKTYRAEYSYDRFNIECDYITLEGSYSYPGDHGTNEYCLYFTEFDDPTAYISMFSQKLREQQEAAEHVRIDRERSARAAEYEKLKAEFGPR